MVKRNSGAPADKKLKCGHQHESTEDRISSLHITILHHILSFLDTKFAVGTCNLARRWRHTWVSLPTLRFNFHLFYNSHHPTQEDDNRFIHFIDQVFLHRDGSNIRKFFLTYSGDSKRESLFPRLYSWVLASLRHHVEEIDLEVDTDFYPYLPLCLFTSESLKVLKLELGSYEAPFELPNNIALPRLTDLYLTSVRFPDDSLTNAPFSNCPVLESLVIFDCVLPEKNSLNISVPSLKYFKIDQFYSPECRIKVYAPNLTSVSLNACVDIDYTLQSFPSLTTAGINLDVQEVYYYHEPKKRIAIAGLEKQEYARHMLRFLTTARNVNALKLCAWLIEVVSEPRSVLESLSVPFLNLRHLHLQSWLYSESIHAIMHLLNISPNLETLTLEMTKKCHGWHSMSSYWDEDMAELVSTENFWEIGKYLLHHLKYVEIRGVRGWVNELKFLEILLLNSMILEKMVIFTSEEEHSPDIEEELIEFRTKVSNLPRASLNAEILFPRILFEITHLVF